MLLSDLLQHLLIMMWIWLVRGVDDSERLVMTEIHTIYNIGQLQSLSTKFPQCDVEQSCNSDRINHYTYKEKIRYIIIQSIVYTLTRRSLHILSCSETTKNIKYLQKWHLSNPVVGCFLVDMTSKAKFDLLPRDWKYTFLHFLFIFVSISSLLNKSCMQNLYLSKANILLPIIDQIVFNFCSSIIIFKQSFFRK